MKGIINIWKNADVVQKIILVVGLGLMGGIVGIYIPQITNAQKGKDVEPVDTTQSISTTDFDVTGQLQDKNVNVRKNTLEAIRERQKLIRQKEQEKSKYGFDDSYFKSEFNIDSTKTDEQQVVDQSEPIAVNKTSKKTSKVVYVEKQQSTIEKTKPVLTRQKRLAQSTIGDAASSKVFFNAVVHGDHYIGDGELITLRTTEIIDYNGFKLPRNTYIRGIVDNNNNRIEIDISSIGKDDMVSDVDVTIYDKTDRQIGIPVRLTTSQEAKQDVAGDLVDEVSKDIGVPGIRSLSRSGKKAIKDNRVNILNGHKVLIGFNK